MKTKVSHATIKYLNCLKSIYGELKANAAREGAFSDSILRWLVQRSVKTRISVF